MLKKAKHLFTKIGLLFMIFFMVSCRSTMPEQENTKPLNTQHDVSSENNASSDLVNLNWVVYINKEDEEDNFAHLENVINEYLNQVEAGYTIKINPHLSEHLKDISDIMFWSAPDPVLNAQIRQEESIESVKDKYPDADLITIYNGNLPYGYYEGPSYYEDACNLVTKDYY